MPNTDSSPTGDAARQGLTVSEVRGLVSKAKAALLDRSAVDEAVEWVRHPWGILPYQETIIQALTDPEHSALLEGLIRTLLNDLLTRYAIQRNRYLAEEIFHRLCGFENLAREPLLEFFRRYSSALAATLSEAAKARLQVGARTATNSDEGSDPDSQRERGTVHFGATAHIDTELDESLKQTNYAFAKTSPKSLLNRVERWRGVCASARMDADVFALHEFAECDISEIASVLEITTSDTKRRLATVTDYVRTDAPQ